MSFKPSIEVSDPRNSKLTFDNLSNGDFFMWKSDPKTLWQKTSLYSYSPVGWEDVRHNRSASGIVHWEVTRLRIVNIQVEILP